jgi:hypothetical protein
MVHEKINAKLAAPELGVFVLFKKQLQHHG